MAVIGTGAEICTSTTRPSSPALGTIIYETDTASYRWCSNASPVTWIGMIPVGTVQSYAGSTAPTGWLLCAGQSLNASTSPQYADLWSVLSTTYGGSGITAFNVPDLRGRAATGKDDMGGSAASRVTSAASGITGTTLGANGGTQTHTLTTTQMPSHTHTQNAHNHSTGLVGVFQGAFAATGGGVYAWGGSQTTNSNTNNNTATNQNTGGDGAHQNMPPTIILNYIIKY